MKSKDSNSEKSVSYQKKDGRGHARPSFFWYDNDKDLMVCFLVTRINCLANHRQKIMGSYSCAGVSFTHTTRRLDGFLALSRKFVWACTKNLANRFWCNFFSLVVLSLIWKKLVAPFMVFQGGQYFAIVSNGESLLLLFSSASWLLLSWSWCHHSQMFCNESVSHTLDPKHGTDCLEFSENALGTVQC